MNASHPLSAPQNAHQSLHQPPHRSRVRRAALMCLWGALGASLWACGDPSAPSVELDSALSDAGVSDADPLDASLEPDMALDMALEMDADPLDMSPLSEDSGPELDMSPEMDAEVDAELPPDPSLELEAWREACPVEPGPLVEAGGGVYDQEVLTRLSLGGPLGGGQLLVVNPSADDLGANAYLTLKGGRASRQDASGVIRWVSEVGGLTELLGVWDLNEDGALEVLARSGRYAYLIQLSSGRTLWRSPEALVEGRPDVSALSLIRVFEHTNEGPALYLTDSGCGSPGTADGALFRFRQGFGEGFGEGEVQRVELSSVARMGGRCTGEHLLARGTSERADALMVMNAQGLQAFELSEGSLARCSVIEDLPNPGLSDPVEVTLDESERAWLIFHPNELLLARDLPLADPLEAPHCPEGATQALQAAWRLPLPSLTHQLVTIEVPSPLSEGSQEVTSVALVSYEGEGGSVEMSGGVIALNLTSGELIGRVEGWRLLGELPQREGKARLLLARVDEGVPTSAPAAVNLFELNPSALAPLLTQPSAEAILPLTPLWATPYEQLTPFYGEAPSSRPASWRPPLWLIGPQGAPHLLFKQRLDDDQERVVSLGDPREVSATSVNANGLWGALEEGGPWRAMSASCALSGCTHPDLITLAGAGGAVRSYRPDLSPLNSAELGSEGGLSVPTGGVGVAWTPSEGVASSPLLLTLSVTGELRAYEPPTTPADRWSERWRASLGAQGLPLSPKLHTSRQLNPTVALPNTRDPLSLTWVGLNLETGEERWSHSLSRAWWYSFAGGVSAPREGEEALLLRHERLEDPQGLSELEPCEREWVYSDVESPLTAEGAPLPNDPRLFTQRPACPARPARPQVLHAIGVESGRCVWRALVRPADDCFFASRQGVSVADVEGDGVFEVYMTETSALRRFELATGELEVSWRASLSPTNGKRGGGAVLPLDGAPLRVGGNGPPELMSPLDPAETAELAYAPQDNSRWQVGRWEGLRDQAWINRPALTDEEGAWLSVGLSLPLARLDAQGELRALLSFEGALSAGLAPLRLLPLSEHLTRAEEVRLLSREPNGALFVGTLEGGAYVINTPLLSSIAEGEALTPSLTRFEQHSAALSAHLWLDWDQDGLQERLLAHEGGEVLVYQHSALEGPAEVWIADCGVEVSCEGGAGAEAVSVLTRADALCYGWTPIEGLSGAEVQLRDESGAALTGWRPAPLSGRGVLEGLQLVPGPTYQLAVRGWREADEGPLVSQERLSAGARFEDVTPPSVTLTLTSPEAPVLTEEERLEVFVSATDDVSLSGWSAAIYASSGVRVRSLERGSLEALTLERLLSWDGRLSTGDRAPAGEYELRVSCADSSGLTALTRLPFRLE